MKQDYPYSAFSTFYLRKCEHLTSLGRSHHPDCYNGILDLDMIFIEFVVE